jgi:membrane fusion protein, multidrug efflux system
MTETTDTTNDQRQPPAGQQQQQPPVGQQQQAPLPSSERDLRRTPKKPMSPRTKLLLIVGIVILLIAGFFLWRYLSSYESTDDAEIDGHLNSVSARVSGHVSKLLVSDNQYVDAGTPLIQIDPSDYQVALAQAQADYDEAVASARGAEANVPVTTVSAGSQISTAQADVDNARAGVASAKQQFDAAKAQLAQAQANNTKVQSDLVRYKQLVDKQEISDQQYDQALAAAQAGAAQVDAARAAASSAEHQITQAQSKELSAEAALRSSRTAPEQVVAIRAKASSAQAEVEAKKAALDQAKLNLQYTLITAPTNGVVTNRTVEVGQNVSVGQEMMKIINLDDIWVTANFKETQLREMRVGQRVTVKVDTTGETYKGVVQSIAGASGAVTSLLPPENATGNYVKVVQRIPVKITFDAGETNQHVLRPGMSVDPKVWLR